MNRKTNLKKGFSLVELMIVVAVMAILSTVGFFAYNNFQKTARDSKRKADLKTMATALQGYYSQNGSYPVLAGATANGVVTAGTPSGSQSLLDGALASYGGKVPLAPASGLADPNAEYQYAYWADSTLPLGSKYALCAQLEGTAGQMWVVTSDDPAGHSTGNGACDNVL